MAGNFKFTYFILIIIFSKNSQTQRSYKIQAVSYCHDVHPDFIKEISMKLVNSSDHEAINGSVIFAQDIEKFTIRIAATMTNANDVEWTPVNLTINGCEVITQDKTNIGFVVKQLMKTAKEMTLNLPEKCPIKKDTEISFLNFYMAPDGFAPNLPHMQIKVSITMRSKSVDFFKGFLKLKVISKTGKNNERRRG